MVAFTEDALWMNCHSLHSCVLGSALSYVSGDHHTELYWIQHCFPSWSLRTQDCGTRAGTGCSALTAAKILSSNALPYLTQAVLFRCGGRKDGAERIARTPLFTYEGQESAFVLIYLIFVVWWTFGSCLITMRPQKT